MSKVAVFLILLSLLSACKSDSYKAVSGLWLIHKAKHGNEDVLPCFLGNGISFEESGECLIPYTSPEECISLNATVHNGSWDLDEDNRFLVIKSKNSFFDKKYELSFYDDTTDNLLEMRLCYRGDTIACRKILNVYNKNKISKLVKLNK